MKRSYLQPPLTADDWMVRLMDDIDSLRPKMHSTKINWPTGGRLEWREDLVGLMDFEQDHQLTFCNIH